MKFKYVFDAQMDTKNSHTVEGALGMRKKLDFPYQTQASLDDALKKMSLYDMQDVAIKLAIRPISNRHRLAKVVSEKFAALKRSYGSAIELGIAPEEKEEFDPKNYK